MKIIRDALRTAFIAINLLFSGMCMGADTIKIAFIDALSGPYADIGQSNLRQYQAAVEFANANGGALGLKLELVPFDDKSSVKEALLHLDQVIQQGIRYVTQGVSPEVAVALREAIDAHNESSPSRAVLFLDYGAGAPVLDDAQCSFWHFRFDASVAMKMRLLSDGIAKDEAVRSVYLLNQDDAWGQNVSREAQRMLAEKRPDIQIVGDDLHPVGKVKDFSGYMARISESGADAVLTGDRGGDLSLLMRAANQAGMKTKYFLLGTSIFGAPAAIGAAGANRVSNVFTWHANIHGNRLEQFADAFKTQYEEEWNGLPSYVAVHMLVTAMETARATEPLRVARVMEGLSFLGANGPTAMRKDNHQLLQPLFLATLTKAGAASVTHDAEATGYGWKTVLRAEPDETVLSTSCNMQRPR